MGRERPRPLRGLGKSCPEHDQIKNLARKRPVDAASVADVCPLRVCADRPLDCRVRHPQHLIETVWGPMDPHRDSVRGYVGRREPNDLGKESRDGDSNRPRKAVKPPCHSAPVLAGLLCEGCCCLALQRQTERFQRAVAYPCRRGVTARHASRRWWRLHVRAGRRRSAPGECMSVFAPAQSPAETHRSKPYPPTGVTAGSSRGSTADSRARGSPWATDTRTSGGSRGTP